MPSSGILLLERSFCASYGFPSHCSLGLRPSLSFGPWKRSAARARLAEVVAELTGCLGLEERSGGDVFGNGATIFAESILLDCVVDMGGGWYLFRGVLEDVVLFSLLVGILLVGDLEGRVRPPLPDIADAGLEYGLGRPVESWDCLRLLLTGIREVGEGSFGTEEFLRKMFRVPECGGVGYSAGTACVLRLGMLGTGCGFMASISLRLRLCCRVCFRGDSKAGRVMSWCD